jgi:2-polyprenyl-6-methoxyphenol hydroxylase-like FAD-dependent oxidoreductase
MNRFVVVGAGPAGLSLSLQLARAGHSVELVEASRAFARVFRGDALMPCGQEALARMGLTELLEGLPQRQLEGWRVWIEGRLLFEVAEPMGSLQPCRLVPQQRLLEALLGQALKQPSLRWLPGQAVQELDWERGRISGVRLADGSLCRGDLVLGCDGRSSLLRRQAGLALIPQGPRLELLWFVLPGPIPEGCVWGFETLVRGGAIASACRGANGDLQLAWLLESGQSTPELSAEAWSERFAAMGSAALAQLLRQRGDELSTPLRFSVQVGMAERWQRPGLLLLGDAAHPMSPVRAQGINMALRDSLMAAAELTSCRHQRTLDQAAERIETQRRPEIRRMQALQTAEARQGHLVGRSALLRGLLSGGAPLLGPLAQRIWQARQIPMREGLASALPADEMLAQ